MTEVSVKFDAAEDYERLMGDWSRVAGKRFLEWLAPADALRWLDIGCGTGAFTRLIVETCSARSVAGVDPAPAQIDYARQTLPNVDFQVGDATALPFADGTFDIVVSALTLNFVRDRVGAFAAMTRVLRPGGIVAAYLWDRSPGADFSPHAPMELGLRRIGADVLTPPAVPESTRDGAGAALERAGFIDIAVTTLNASRTFRSFDDYWQIQTMLLAPTGKSIAKLSEQDRDRLRETMYSILAPAADGTVTYSARTLAFKARKKA